MLLSLMDLSPFSWHTLLIKLSLGQYPATFFIRLRRFFLPSQWIFQKKYFQLNWITTFFFISKYYINEYGLLSQIKNVTILKFASSWEIMSKYANIRPIVCFVIANKLICYDILYLTSKVFPAFAVDFSKKIFSIELNRNIFFYI